MALPMAVYSAAQVRAIDQHMIRERGVPSFTLMKRAAEAALRALRTRWPTAMQICVVCGGGNNGGDGYVVARFAQAAGLKVAVLAVTPPEDLIGDARRACDEWRASGGQVQPFAAFELDAAEVVVDAILGIGVKGELRPAARAAIDAINASAAPVLSLDVPSGLDADSGEVLGAAVEADATITFIGLKTGLLLGDGPEHAGVLLFDDLEAVIPGDTAFRPRLARLTEAEIAAALPRRSRHAHKGSFGRLLIIGGGPGMPGALRLCGEAALRVGAGLVTVAGSPENLAAVVSGRPELMFAPLSDARDLEALVERVDVVAVGPGLGRTPWARRVCEHVFGCGKPLVIDADALNELAEMPVRALPNAILTPHPGEAGRLLGSDSHEVQRDRLASVERLAARYGAVAVLKGAGTLVASATGTSICERGNPGMATPGMGDVLTGAIAGVLAQHRDLGTAARVGVLVHALAGDIAARDGQRGLVASDVLRELRGTVNR